MKAVFKKDIFFFLLLANLLLSSWPLFFLFLQGGNEGSTHTHKKKIFSYFSLFSVFRPGFSFISFSYGAFKGTCSSSWQQLAYLATAGASATWGLGWRLRGEGVVVRKWTRKRRRRRKVEGDGGEERGDDKYRRREVTGKMEGEIRGGKEKGTE